MLNAVLFTLMGLKMLVFRIRDQYLGAELAAAAAVLLARLMSVSIPLSSYGPGANWRWCGRRKDLSKQNGPAATSATGPFCFQA